MALQTISDVGGCEGLALGFFAFFGEEAPPPADADAAAFLTGDDGTTVGETAAGAAVSAMFAIRLKL